MPKSEIVKLDDRIIVAQHLRVKGQRRNEAGPTTSGMFDCTIKDLFDLSYGNKHQYKDDSFFLPGRHEEKIYRYKIIDAQFDYKDEFKFCLIPLDIDLINEGDRSRWQNNTQATRAVQQLVTKTPLLKHARVVCSSRGGIRAIFLLDKYVNALEWRTLYEKVVNRIAADLDGEFSKKGKLLFTINKLSFALDPRNPGSMTRVPYGYRDGKPVRDQEYFYHQSQDTQLPIDFFGRLIESDMLKIERKGFTTMNLPLPRPKTLEELPRWITPFQWADEPPGEGQRELTLFSIVNRAKYRYTDRLTPGQYYTYFHDAVKQIPSMRDMDIMDLLWSKIVRNYYVRSDADTANGKRYDRTQLNNAGGIAFYPATDFDDILMPFEAYRYSKRKQKECIGFLLGMKEGTVFLNPPPGAGKSTAAVKLLEKKGGIYIAPSNKQINDIMKRLSCEANLVLSYRELIRVVCAGDEKAIALLEAMYDLEYSPKYKSAAYNVALLINEDPEGRFDRSMMIRNRHFYMVKSFPQYIQEKFPVQAAQMKRENERRIGELERGALSLLTKDKFLTLMHRQTTLALSLEHQIIYDEAEPEDIIDPQIYASSTPVTVYGKQYYPTMEIDYTSQLNFIQFLKNRPTIFINANRGLDRALKHNGFDDVKVIGSDMRAILDNDLHIVLSPDLKAGYAPHRNEEDDTEISPRALYAKQVNRKTYTLMTNGKDIEGVPLASKDNLKRVIGSNDYINTRVISIITTPTPEQIAELCFCAGLKVENAKKLLFQNLINQVISRNVGYRGHKITNAIREQDLNMIKANHNNEHILVLPHATLNDEIELIVKTVNVWTAKSIKVPDRIQPYINLVPLAVKARAELYQVEPGGFTTLDLLSEKLDCGPKQLSFVLKDLKDDPMLADFELVKRTRIHGTQLRNVIKRYETLFEIVLDCFRKISNGTRFRDFIKLLIKATSERYIKVLTAKDLKTYIRQEAFRFEFRLLKIRNVEYLVRTGAEEYFEPLILRKPVV